MLLHNFACMPCNIKHTSTIKAQDAHCRCSTVHAQHLWTIILISGYGHQQVATRVHAMHHVQATTSTCLEATAELSSGQLKNSCGAILAGGGQVLAVRRHSHGIQTLLGDIQGCGWTPLWTGRQCFHSKAAFAAAGFLSLQDSSSHEAPCVRDCGV